MTRRRVASVLLALGATLGAVGCIGDETSTCQVASEDMSIVGKVIDSGASIRAEIDFEAGDRSGIDRPLELCEDDRLEINGEQPTETERPGRIVYAVTFPADAERVVEFDFDRRGLGERIVIEAPVPPAFEILAPAADAVVPRASDLLMEWDPPESDPDKTMRIELGEEVGGGVCIFTDEGEHHYKQLGGVDVPDDGNWLVPGGTVHSESDAECAAYYLLKRIAGAEYPSAFGPGGHVEARADRSVAFRSAP